MFTWLSHNWYYIVAGIEAIFRIVPTKKPISPVSLILNAANKLSGALDNSPSKEETP